MAELPVLPEEIRRLHRLRWNALVVKHGFTGEHLRWHESPERRYHAAKPRFSLAPPPITPITSAIRGDTTLDGTDGQPVPYDEWLKQQKAARVRRESETYIIDSIGVRESVTLAKARFSEIIGDYLQLWARDTDHNSDEFHNWSVGVADLVTREMCDLWQKDQWHASWFERACQDKINEALVPLTTEWHSRASKLEMQALERQLNIQSLLVSEGNSSLPSTVEHNRATIKAAQQSLHILENREASPPQSQGKAPQRVKAGLCEDELVPGPPREQPSFQINATQCVGDPTQDFKANKQARSQLGKEMRQKSRSPEAPVQEELIDEHTSVQERSERRMAEVMPILASKRWTPNKWATKAGVSKNSVYQYLDGRRNLSVQNRQALAEELGLTPEDLPD